MNCPLCGAPLDFVSQDLERRLQCRESYSHQMILRELYEYRIGRTTLEKIKASMEKRREVIERTTYRI